MRRSVLIALQLALLVAALVVAGLTSRAGDWEPIGLVVLLAVLAVASDMVIIETRGLRVSGSFIALVLAMAFLGPAPAVAIGMLLMAVDVVRHRPAPLAVVNNLATYAVFPCVGALAARAVIHAGIDQETLAFAVVVCALCLATNMLNFALTALGLWSFFDASPRRLVRDVLVPVLPSEAAAATLVLAFSIAYIRAGFWALAVLVVALFAFQYLTRALLLSQDRAEQLAERTTELASLQVGVLAALMQTLSLRDKMTARHSAAVARYARAMAAALGCSQADQELVHTAGLLHDIGKFIFPDRILFADRRLTDEDWEIVKRHPGQGARVVGKVAGYGPVAEIIRHHHERIDGGGYPRGLPAEEIPLLSRIISVADTYDVMTARDSYRDPVSREHAIDELRRVSGTQLDGDVVEVFIGLLRGTEMGFGHSNDADFEAELNFEARVRAFADTTRSR